MRTSLVFLFIVVLAVGLAAALARAPEALSRVEAFRVVQVQVEGNRFLSREEAVQALHLSSTASVWDDLETWEERLRRHPLVAEAEVDRRLPGTLVLRVMERMPVALVSNPALEPVDATGRFLPLDPAAHRLDLPLITPRQEEAVSSLSAAERRLAAMEIARMAEWDPEVLARISEVTPGPRGDLKAVLWRRDTLREIWDLPVNLLFNSQVPGHRIQEGLRVLADARTRFGEMGPLDLDLRYEDQVVVRLSRAEGN